MDKTLIMILASHVSLLRMGIREKLKMNFLHTKLPSLMLHYQQ